MNAYVGYMRGGKVKVIARDPSLRAVFYPIDAGPDGGLEIQRDFSGCLSCHGTTVTEHVPGLSVRSVFADFQLYHQLFKHRCSYMVYS